MDFGLKGFHNKTTVLLTMIKTLLMYFFEYRNRTFQQILGNLLRPDIAPFIGNLMKTGGFEKLEKKSYNLWGV